MRRQWADFGGGQSRRGSTPLLNAPDSRKGGALSQEGWNAVTPGLSLWALSWM